MVIDDILGLFAPVFCSVCARPGSLLCDRCARELAPPLDPLDLPGIAWCGAAWRYEGTARDLVLALKLRGVRAAAEPLAGAIVRALVHRPATVTWVPGRGRDIRQRGFDHAELIARAVARRIGAISLPLITRVAEPPDQTTLSAAQRRRNLEGAFTSTTSPPESLIVDDLITTGATMRVCARSLRRAGARRIYAVAACRA